MRASGRAHGAAPAPHIVFVGLPGSGKSTVGSAVAAYLGRPFVDFDREIARRERMSVAAIFATHGEPYFRARERGLTAELRGRPGMVLAPGGGWIMNAGVVALLRPPARLVYLRISPEAALDRLGNSPHVRPLLSGPDPLGALRRLLAEREPRYLEADHVVDVEDVDRKEVVTRIALLASTCG